MSKPKAHVSDQKKQTVTELVSLIKQYPVIGLVNMENLPAPQLQNMKRGLRGKAILQMTKKRLITIALAQAGGTYSMLTKKIVGMPALIFTKENPFKLYKLLAASKSQAPAKPGQVAPCDVTIPAGKTPFAPGPVIGELGQLGIKTGIEDGKIVIKADTVVVKEGQPFTQKVTEMLTRMNIFPMEVGLNIVAVYEKGVIFDHKILAVDEKAYIQNIMHLHTEALNLAVKIGYASKDTVTILLQKAHRDASALADSRDILTSDNVGKIMAKAEAQANALKSKSNL